MTSDDTADTFPFKYLDVASDLQLDLRSSRKFNHKVQTKRKPNRHQSNQPPNQKTTSSFIYFENTTKNKTFLKLIPYTGPCNTLHLDKQLVLAQLLSDAGSDPTIDATSCFFRDYDRTVASLASSMETMPLSIYLRFGISYIIPANRAFDEIIPLEDFVIRRTRGTQMKTAFYTCKGVTSPKRLLTTIAKLNYQAISSNTYSYEIQIYGKKTDQYPLLYFQYDAQLQCQAVYCRPDFPINFDFLRDKSSSSFRSIDHSYSDIFDYRIQLTQGKHLSKTDPAVLEVLRGVPINEVLYLEKSTQVLYTSFALRKFVKYLKCTRSSNFQNFDERIQISIGTYEEFQLNKQGQCEPLMTASNTMTIEFLDSTNIPSGKKLYETGMWFSTLCQSCVDSSVTNQATVENSKKSCRWFSDLLLFGNKANQSIKPMNVNQLTTYRNTDPRRVMRMKN